MTQQINPGPPPPYGPPPYGPPPTAQPPYAQPAYGPPFGPPPGGGPAGSPPRKKRTGLIVGSIVGVLVLAGLGVGAFFLFSTKYLDTVEAQRKIAEITQQQIGQTPANVRCPSDVKLATGTTFTCTAELEGQPISFTVRETDDKGNVRVDSDNEFVVVAKVEESLNQQVGDRAGVDVTTTCDTGGRHVLVDAFGKPISCTVTNTTDETDAIQVTAKVDDQGTVSYQVDE